MTTLGGAVQGKIMLNKKLWIFKFAEVGESGESWSLARKRWPKVSTLGAWWMFLDNLPLLKVFLDKFSVLKVLLHQAGGSRWAAASSDPFDAFYHTLDHTLHLITRYIWSHSAFDHTLVLLLAYCSLLSTLSLVLTGGSRRRRKNLQYTLHLLLSSVNFFIFYIMSNSL